MHLEPGRRRKTLINVTSLIDVVFLLLIFFVVTSTFLEQPGLDLTLPEAGSAEMTVREQVTLGVDADGEIFLNGDPVVLEGLADRIEQALERAETERVLLEADSRVSHGRVVALMDAARRAGAGALLVATRPPEEAAREP
jgi:biopolymer transport protein ExbD